MMIDENKNGLKGQHIPAQGKRSGALGWNTEMKIVRAIMFFGWLSLFRTKRHESQFRPKNVFHPDQCICADRFLFIPFPSGVA
jgi:hypothetical protein